MPETVLLLHRTHVSPNADLAKFDKSLNKEEHYQMEKRLVKQSLSSNNEKCVPVLNIPIYFSFGFVESFQE